MCVCAYSFLGYGAHRDLHVLTHSFPTRRSSELAGGDGDIDGTIATRGRTLDGGGFDATLSVPTLTGTLRGRTLDGKAEFTAQGETYRGTANLTLDSGHIDIEGDAGTAPRLHWDARATLDGFDPGFFVDGWTGAVDANIASKGGAREDDGYD